MRSTPTHIEYIKWIIQKVKKVGIKYLCVEKKNKATHCLKILNYHHNTVNTQKLVIHKKLTIKLSEVNQIYLIWCYQLIFSSKKSNLLTHFHGRILPSSLQENGNLNHIMGLDQFIFYSSNGPLDRIDSFSTE